MAIYTWTGALVEITEARMVPVWIVRLPSQIKWLYAKPTRHYKHIEERPMWHYKGIYPDMHRAPIHDGKWISATGLRADGAWNEIEDKLIDLCPDAPAKYKAWNKVGAPDATHFFPPIGEKEVA